MNIAESLLGREVRAIDQGRLCRLPSYADYCEYVKLPRPRRFEDISKNKQVVDVLKAAYERVVR